MKICVPHLERKAPTVEKCVLRDFGPNARKRMEKGWYTVLGTENDNIVVSGPYNDISQAWENTPEYVPGDGMPGASYWNGTEWTFGE